MRREGRNQLLAAGIAAAAVFGSTQSLAHLAPPAGPTSTGNTVSPLVLTAPEKQNELVDPTTQFVRQHLPESRTEQLPRFHDAVCVKVVGLPEEFDAFVAKRIIAVAGQVRAPVDPSPTCTPNVNVVFTPAPQAQLNDIAKRRDILFGFHFLAEMKKLSTFSRPVQAWYVTRVTDTTGKSSLEVMDPHPYDPEIGKMPALMGRPGSRLGKDMSVEIVHSLIIADANKVAGEKIEVIADYVAVLALARWQGLEHCNGVSTILNLMADGCDADRPEAATPSDLALLSGLYSVSTRESGSQQRASIASAIRRAAADAK
jgi:hypothetical protein